jgi:hypothetical protein
VIIFAVLIILGLSWWSFNIYLAHKGGYTGW